jgi:hypothetical protein
MAADLHFECDLNAPLKNTLSQQSEKANQLHDGNSARRTHLISCRVDHTCFVMCAIPSRQCKCARLFATSASGNILARFV